MNTRIGKLLSARGMRFQFPLSIAWVMLAVGSTGLLMADERPTSPDLTVHEWGTFTAVAGQDGKPVQWVPLTGSTNLPSFVEHFSDVNFKLGLRGTIRMETPVLYFYSPRDVTVSVHVSFAKGVFTEWYPHATRSQPSEPLRNNDLRQLAADGSIAWSGVSVSPSLSAEFPREVRSNRYYAARETASTPLSVKTRAGDQQEKFLFYRGVSAASLPLSAKQNVDGELLVKSLDENQVPAVILFERRGERVGYRVMVTPTKETVLAPPELTGNLPSLLADLEGLLIDQGLYPDEAHAMIKTWRRSWFEEGSRLIYLVPRGFVDKVVPLTIDPVPSQVVRVFVGRLELVTPATAKAVSAALRSDDEEVLNKYRRFLEPILQTMGVDRGAIQATGHRQ
ncbi:MAG TPA: hypothetical protein VEI99_02700 [Terriglobales bacterium]|nr:hypothetical protein [Terriglobales bacterium]